MEANESDELFSERMRVVTKADAGGIKGFCKNLAQKLRDFKEYDSQKYLDLIAGEDQSYEVPADHAEHAREIKHIRDKMELQQLWLRRLAIVNMVTAFVYFITRCFALSSFLQHEEQVEQDMHFVYAYQIHVLNLVHSIVFACLGTFIGVKASQSGFTLKKEHYGRVMNCIVASALLYLVPLLGIISFSYYYGSNESDSNYDDDDLLTKRSPHGFVLFISWLGKTLLSTKPGVPLLFSFLVHCQLIILLGALWFISEDLYVNMERLASLRRAAKQDQHNALELNSYALPMEFSRTRSPPRPTLMQQEFMNQRDSSI